MNPVPIKRALLSVANKSGMIEFAKGLVALDIEIISTGGTSQILRKAGIAHQQVESITGFPGMLDGRVKTLHPKIHGGILGRRDEHAREAAQHQIDWIDLVVVNFYPFSEAIQKPDAAWDDIVEEIDIGGPTMVRAAAKNFAWVGVVVDVNDYGAILAELKEHHGLSWQMRKALAQKAFATTQAYDEMIYHYFLKDQQEKNKGRESVFFPEEMTLSLEKESVLRYGENPHQRASAYRIEGEAPGILSSKQWQGKEVSYNNILDAEAAWLALSEFSDPACVIVKHANPCGVAVADDIDTAFSRAYEADSLSAFGGIVALNRPCTKAIAQTITSIFMEVILAPDFSEDALALFKTKPNLRLLSLPLDAPSSHEFKFISGGALLQERDQQTLTAADLKVVTRAKPHDMASLLFAWQVVKHIKSNAILIAKDHTTVGIGAGQVSRIDSVDIALRKAGKKAHGAVLASDAFFPFRDSIDRLCGFGIQAIIQPGGSVRDQEVIDACDELGISMVFTGKRCFRH